MKIMMRRIESTQQFNGLRADVLGALQDRVKDIFINFQNAMEIKSGGISPLDMLELKKRERSLATMITDILVYQKGDD